MNSIALSLLISFVRHLIPDDIADHIRNLVVTALDWDMPGTEKRAKVLEDLYSMGGDVGKKLPEVESWLIAMALEVFVGWAKANYPKASELLASKT